MVDDDRDRERIRETDRTTVVHSDGGRSRGSGLIVGLLLVLALLALLFFLFGGNFNRAADEVGVNVDVDAPKVEVPNVDVPNVDVKVPDKIEVNVPDVDVKTDGNQSR